MTRQPRWVTWGRRGLVMLGAIALLYALAGVLTNEDNLFTYTRFLLLSLVGHELILMPLLVGAGYLIAKLVTPNARPVIQAALISTAAIVLIALPAVTGHGRSTDLPSALPRDYQRGLLIFVACIWATALTALLAKKVRDGRKHTDDSRA